MRRSASARRPARPVALHATTVSRGQAPFTRRPRRRGAAWRGLARLRGGALCGPSGGGGGLSPRRRVSGGPRGLRLSCRATRRGLLVARGVLALSLFTQREDGAGRGPEGGGRRASVRARLLGGTLALPAGLAVLGGPARGGATLSGSGGRQSTGCICPSRGPTRVFFFTTRAAAVIAARARPSIFLVFAPPIGLLLATTIAETIATTIGARTEFRR